MTEENGRGNEDGGNIGNQFGLGNREENKDEENPYQEEAFFRGLKEGNIFLPHSFPCFQ